MNQQIIIGVLAGLLIGLGGGYSFALMAQPTATLTTPHEMYRDDIVEGDGAMMHAMDEMMRTGRGQTGADYEEAWLRGMIVHHIGAIAMSEQLLEETERPELIELANNIISSQSTEVAQMKEWLNTWFNEN